MDYEVDLATRKSGTEKEALWSSILQTLVSKFETVPKEQRNERHDDWVDQWCEEIAKTTGLTYYRNDNWLCFCDKELAPN